jgi:hypothetical protein
VVIVYIMRQTATILPGESGLLVEDTTGSYLER